MMNHLLHNLELVEFIKTDIVHDNNTYDFTPTVKRLPVQCLVAPTSTTNENDTVDETFTLYIFDSVDVSFYDEVIVRGKTGVVEGCPRIWIAPMSKRVKGQEVRVRIIANEEKNN